MQLLCGRLVWVALYAECLFNGQYFEEERKIAILSAAKLPGDVFANQILILGKMAGE